MLVLGGLFDCWLWVRCSIVLLLFATAQSVCHVVWLSNYGFAV